MQCPRCGSDLSEGATYCPACLRSIPPSERDPEAGGEPASGELWETALAGVLLVVVVLSAVLLLS